MLPYLPKTAPERIPKDFALQKGTASKRAGNQTLRRAQSADGLETWTFPTGYESGDDLARNPSERRARANSLVRVAYRVTNVKQNPEDKLYRAVLNTP